MQRQQNVNVEEVQIVNKIKSTENGFNRVVHRYISLQNLSRLLNRTFNRTKEKSATMLALFKKKYLDTKYVISCQGVLKKLMYS